ncbi:MAG TPA: fibronectin type III domain-containing protein [Pseudobdellovibrionaceae bacterium]
MKIFVSVLVFVTALTVGVQSLAMNKEGSIDMDGLFPPPQSNLSFGERPAKPELTAPSFFQKINASQATLTWKAVPTAESYHVQLATDPNFKWLVKEEQLLKGTTLEVAGLESGKHYFWRVSAMKPENKNGHIQGAFSSSMFVTSATK